MTQTVGELEAQIEGLIERGQDVQTEIDELRGLLSDLALAVVDGAENAQTEFLKTQQQIADLEATQQMVDLATIAAGRKLEGLRVAEMDATRRAALAERDRLLEGRGALWLEIGAATRALTALCARSLQLDRAAYQKAVEGEDKTANAIYTGGRRSVFTYIEWKMNDMGMDVARPNGEMRRQLVKSFGEQEIEEPFDEQEQEEMES